MERLIIYFEGPLDGHIVKVAISQLAIIDSRYKKMYLSKEVKHSLLKKGVDYNLIKCFKYNKTSSPWYSPNSITYNSASFNWTTSFQGVAHSTTTT
jgi:hypothetical protein